MPNYVANIIYFESAKDAEAIRKEVESENFGFDFNKVIPMPETYKKYDTTNHPDGDRLVLGHLYTDPVTKKNSTVTKKLIEEFKKATKEQREKYGAVGWYDWSCKYWGTKWNACESNWGETAVEFDTAWSAPVPVFEALAKKHPKMRFKVVAADEDASYNCMSGVAVDGQFLYRYPNGGGPEAWELYFETHEYAREDYEEQEDGTYKYIE